MTIPESQHLCTEIQVGMTQEAQKKPEEMGWCLTKKECLSTCLEIMQIIIMFNAASITTSPTKCSTLIVISILYENEKKGEKFTLKSSMVVLGLSMLRDWRSPTEKERSDL